MLINITWNGVFMKVEIGTELTEFQTLKLNVTLKDILIQFKDTREIGELQEIIGTEKDGK